MRETIIDNYVVRDEEDPFVGNASLDFLHENQAEAVDAWIKRMLQEVEKNGMPAIDCDWLLALIVLHMHVLRTAFWAGSPAKVKLLNNDLLRDSKPMRVRLRKCFQEYPANLSKSVAQLVQSRMAQPNPFATWACAPLLEKHALAGFWLTDEMRSVNAFTVQYQFPMLNLERKLIKTAGSKSFALCVLPCGYWQLPWEKYSQ